jgi:N-methylhydantoinase B
MPWIYFYSAQSGYGATPGNDGHSFSQIPLANGIDPSVEAVEQDLPVVIVERQFTTDSGGPGRHRGGMGTTYSIGLLADAQVSNSDERTRSGPFGVEGALGSHRTYIERSTGVAATIRHPDDVATTPITGLYVDAATGEDRFLTGKFTSLAMKADEVFIKVTPGGGGSGDPLARDPAAVAEDVVNGLVSARGAVEDYGVVLLGDGSVDAVATAARRASYRTSKAFADRTGPAAWETREFPGTARAA